MPTFDVLELMPSQSREISAPLKQNRFAWCGQRKEGLPRGRAARRSIGHLLLGASRSNRAADLAPGGANLDRWRGVGRARGPSGTTRAGFRQPLYRSFMAISATARTASLVARMTCRK